MKTESIWQNFDRELARFICAKVKNQDVCHDILQNVYVKVIGNTERIEKANNISAYLFRIASNEVYNFYRTSPKHTEIELTDELLDDKEINTQQLRLADCCLRPIIEALSPIYRDALIMVELEGLSQVALAEKLGVSISGAKSRVQRAREKLKNEILKCCNYEFDKYGNILSVVKNKH